MVSFNSQHVFPGAPLSARNSTQNRFYEAHDVGTGKEIIFSVYCDALQDPLSIKSRTAKTSSFTGFHIMPATCWPVSVLIKENEADLFYRILELGMMTAFRVGDLM